MVLHLSALRVLAAGLAGTAAYAAFEAARLRAQYPWHAAPYSGPLGAVLHAHGFGGDGFVSTVVARAPLAACTSAAAPLDTFLDAFYATWTLRLEALAMRVSRLAVRVPPFLTPTGDDRASGLFRGVYRDDAEGTAAVFWGSFPGFGGVQVFRAVLDDQGGMELAFGGAETLLPRGPRVTEAMYAFHRMYARFLLDRAKTRLEQWERERW